MRTGMCKLLIYGLLRSKTESYSEGAFPLALVSVSLDYAIFFCGNIFLHPGCSSLKTPASDRGSTEIPGLFLQRNQCSQNTGKAAWLWGDWGQTAAEHCDALTHHPSRPVWGAGAASDVRGLPACS